MNTQGHVKPRGHTGYLPLSYKSLCAIESKIGNLIKEKAPPYDGIAVRGTSGMLVAGLLATALKKPVAVIRKPDSYTHSSWSVEVGDDMQTYIIVDDLIDSGATVAAIMKAMQPATCVGVFLYNTNDTDSGDIHGLKCPVRGINCLP